MLDPNNPVQALNSRVVRIDKNDSCQIGELLRAQPELDLIGQEPDGAVFVAPDPRRRYDQIPPVWDVFTQEEREQDEPAAVAGDFRLEPLNLSTSSLAFIDSPATAVSLGSYSRRRSAARFR